MRCNLACITAPSKQIIHYYKGYRSFHADVHPPAAENARESAILGTIPIAQPLHWLSEQVEHLEEGLKYMMGSSQSSSSRNEAGHVPDIPPLSLLFTLLAITEDTIISRRKEQRKKLRIIDTACFVLLQSPTRILFTWPAILSILLENIRKNGGLLPIRSHRLRL